MLAQCLLLISVFVVAPSVQAQTSQNVVVGVGATTLTINGHTSPASFVTVLESDTAIGTTTSDSMGNFSIPTTFAEGGIYAISVYARTPINTLTDTVTQNVNVTQHFNTDFTVFLPPTIQISDTQVVVGQTIYFSGFASPNSTVTLHIDNNNTQQAFTDSSGAWQIPVNTTGYYAGGHTAFAVTNDEYGSQSSPTSKRSFVVTVPQPTTPPSTTPPSPPLLSQIPPVPTVTTPLDNTRTYDSIITVTGAAAANSRIELWDDDTIVSSAFANHLGKWYFQFSLEKSQHNFRVRSCIGLVCSALSESFAVYYVQAISPTTPSKIMQLKLQEYAYTIRNNQSINLGFQLTNGTLPYSVTVDWGDDTVTVHDINKQGTHTLIQDFQTPGHYTGTITVTDSQGQKSIRYFSVSVLENTSPYATLRTPLLWLIGIALVLGIFMGIRTRTTLSVR